MRCPASIALSVIAAHGIGFVFVPDVRSERPVCGAIANLLFEPSLDARVIARELLPQFGSGGKLPIVHVGRVDASPFREKDEASLACAITPQGKPRREWANSRRQCVRGDVA